MTKAQGLNQFGTIFNASDVNSELTKFGHNLFNLQTDRDGIHQKGHWGYCDKGEGECPMSEIDQLLQTVSK